MTANQTKTWQEWSETCSLLSQEWLRYILSCDRTGLRHVLTCRRNGWDMVSGLVTSLQLFGTMGWVLYCIPLVPYKFWVFINWQLLLDDLSFYCKVSIFFFKSVKFHSLHFNTQLEKMNLHNINANVHWIWGY